MTLLPMLFAAITVAFPRPEVFVPAVTRCYAIGAVEPGVSQVWVNGKSVPVYRTGAWATTVAVTTGVNRLTVAVRGAAQCELTNVLFKVGVPRPAAASTASVARATAPAQPRVYERLACSKETLRPHPAGKEPSETVIWLDAGHGGPKDLGCRSPHDCKEKDANLLLACDVGKALEALGYVVRMTRTNDVALALYDRPVAPHAGEADAFVSLHYNAPAADGDVANVRYAAVYAWKDAGLALAASIASNMDAVVRSELPSKGALKANYAVTRSAEIPSCLVEADFLTHPAGEEAAFDPVRRRRLASAIAEGVRIWHAGGKNDLRARKHADGTRSAEVTVAGRRTALPDGSSAVRGVAATCDGKYVFIVHGLGRYNLPATQLDRGWINSAALSVFDGTTGRYVNTAMLDDPFAGAANPWGIAVNDRWIAVTHAGTHELSLIPRAPFVEAVTKAKEDLSSDSGLMTRLGRRRIAFKGKGPRAVRFRDDGRIEVRLHFAETTAVVDPETGAVDEPVLPGGVSAAVAADPVRRGEAWFHDASVCYQGWQSCASCHVDGRNDGLRWDFPGSGGGIGHPEETVDLSQIKELSPTCVPNSFRDDCLYRAPKAVVSDVEAFIRAGTQVKSGE